MSSCEAFDMHENGVWQASQAISPKTPDSLSKTNLPFSERKRRTEQTDTIINTKIPRQSGRGTLDTWVQRSVEAKETIPNERTTQLNLPPDFHIISDTSYFIKKYSLTTRRLEVRAQSDVDDFINNLLKELIRQVGPEDKVAMSVASEEIPKEVCHISFRRAKFLTYEVVLKAIKAMMQSGSLNEHFLDDPVRIVFHRCEGIHGQGRKRKGTQDLDVYAKCARSIVRIQNDDTLCLARAIVVAIARTEAAVEPQNLELDRRYQSLRDPRKQIQRKAALELLVKAGVSEAECGSSIDKFQAVVDVQINIVEYEGKVPIRIYQGPSVNNDNSPREKVYLLHSDNHFDVITKMAPIFGQTYFCQGCFQAYCKKGEHRCETVCRNCFVTPTCVPTKPRKCSTCNRLFSSEECYYNHQKVSEQGNSICSTHYICSGCHKYINLTKRQNKTHRCGEVFCGICDIHVAEGHQCYIKPILTKPGCKALNAAYVFYDIESVQIKAVDKGLEHEPYLLVSQVACLTCLGQEDTHCKDCGEREKVFIGSSCVSDFMSYVSNHFRNFNRIFCIAHNAKGYDAQWILRYMLDKKWAPEVIENGSKLMRIVYENITFLDSVNYIPLPLSKFSSAFGLPPLSVKGHFPHFLFNVIPHPFNVNDPVSSNYVSPRLPPAEAYDPDGMSSSDRSKFLAWYESNQDSPFNFLEGSLTYCRMDVTVLRQGCTIYRQLYMEKAAVDPFKEASTIAGTCMKIFKTNFLKKELIGIVPAGGYRLRDKQSAEASKWLGWIESQLGRKLESAVNGREKRIEGLKVDGFDPETNTCYEHQGCYFHGHTCLKDRKKSYYGDPSITAESLYEATLHKTNKLRDAGYTVVEKWSCEWEVEVASSQEIQDFLDNFQVAEKFKVLDPREAFFGGRTEAIQLHRKCLPGEKILYQDFTSLYPWVNKNCLYPIGHPTIYLGQECLPLDQSEGLLRCRVLPPRSLYLPVLPVRIDGKLFFPLCYTCARDKIPTCHHSEGERAIAGTWVTCELRKAVELGYVILETFELWHYPRTTQFDRSSGKGGLFAEYVNLWLKLKQEASGWPSLSMTEDEKLAYIVNYKANEGIHLDYDNIKVNPGLRQIAKLNLNSLWGKFGQRPDLTKTEIVTEADKWFDLLYDPSVEVQSVLPINEDVIITKWAHVQEVDIVQRSQNVVIAAYTTAMARLKLYSILEKLQERVLYFDTDSVIYTCAPGEEALPTGDYLGELTDELAGYGPDSFIDEFASGGSKNYGYSVKTPTSTKETMKCKGIRLNQRNGSLVNFTTLKRQLGVDGFLDPITVTEPRGIVRLPDHRVISRCQTKTYRVVFDKRQRLDNFKTLPWGYL